MESVIKWVEGVPQGDAWYALRVRSNFEKLTVAHLESRGYAPFLPLYKSRRTWSDRLKAIDLPLFSGYVFCRFDLHNRLAVVSCPGVVTVVGAGKRPIPIEEQEIDAIRSIAASRYPAEPWPFLQSGQRVRIIRGSLVGVEGLLMSIRKVHRLVVSVSLLQRSVSVEIDRDWVTPVSAVPSFVERAG